MNLRRSLGRIKAGLAVFILNLPGMLKQRYMFSRYLKSNPVSKLNIGCGNNYLRGWINADFIPGRYEIFLDARKKLPLQAESIDYIFCEHFIEHMEMDEIKLFLKECFRVLKKGGIIRINTPSLDKIIDIYLDKSPFVSQEEALKRHKLLNENEEIDRCIFLNEKLRFGQTHKFIFNKETLSHFMERVGFCNIVECKYSESNNEVLRNIDKHADADWMKYAEPIIIEAQKHS